MHTTDTKTPNSFLALTVGIFIGALLVLPMFAYMCRVNGQASQENQRLRANAAWRQACKPLPQWHYNGLPITELDHYENGFL